MKPAGEDTPLPLPPALLAQVRAAAGKERRPTVEVVREAVERYLESQHQTERQHNTARGELAAEQIRELRKGTILPEGITIRDLIEGRA